MSAVIGPIVRTAWKYRKYIYRTLVAQDRAIDKAMRYGGFSRQARYGVRHGVAAGTTIGTIISQTTGTTPDDAPELPIQRNGFASNKFSQKYSRRYSTRNRCRCNNKFSDHKYCK